MSAYEERTLHVEVTTTLTLIQRDATQTETLVDADDTPMVEIRIMGVLAPYVLGDVNHPSTGVYTFTWTPTLLGLHVITWSGAIGADEFDDGDGEGEFESVEKIMVVSDIEGTSDSVGADEEAAAASTDIGASRVCVVTGQFYDAAGNAMLGVYVRFTPTRDTTSFLSSGIVASEVTAQTDEDGAFTMTLVRGVTGTLAITGLGIVREVTIPDTGTVSLKDLVERGPDPLEVQRPTFKKLPRRS